MNIQRNYGLSTKTKTLSQAITPPYSQIKLNIAMLK